MKELHYSSFEDYVNISFLKGQHNEVSHMIDAVALKNGIFQRTGSF
jgi:hypothetical protein